MPSGESLPALRPSCSEISFEIPKPYFYPVILAFFAERGCGAFYFFPSPTLYPESSRSLMCSGNRVSTPGVTFRVILRGGTDL